MPATETDQAPISPPQRLFAARFAKWQAAIRAWLASIGPRF